jgi:nucleoside-diphosphate-sugar epimerase
MINNSNKKILITGSSGFIGRSLDKYLTNKGYTIYRLDNNSRQNNNYSFKGSIFNKKILIKIVSKVDIIIHLAAINGTRNFYNRPKDVFETSFRGILNLYDVIKEVGFKKKVIIASSGEVYGTPKKIPTPENSEMIIKNINNNRNSYGGGKICQDLAARFLISDIVESCIVIRPHNVYGANMGYDHVIPEIFLKILKSKNNKIKIEGSGKETRSFCHIDDFLAAIEKLIKKKLSGFDVYNIGNNKEMKIIEVIKQISQLCKKNIIIKKAKLRKGSVLRRKPNLNKIFKIGYKPKVNLKKGLKDFLENDEKIKSLFLAEVAE